METLERVDLHTHSTASDGTLRPAEVVRLAHERGLGAIALTDHDTIDGLAEAADAAMEAGIQFLPGIEVSCAFPRPGTMHLLGYGFDPQHPDMLRLVRTLDAARQQRAELIVGRLRQIGINLNLEEVRAESGRTGIGRPHLAEALIRRGHAVSTNDAFRRYLGGSGAAWVDNLPLDAGPVIERVRAAGGLVSLAHPLQLRRESFAQLEAMVKELAGQGMDAIETIHSSHDTDTIHRLTRLADRLDLLTTGGSDYHGPHKPWIQIGQAGRRSIPRWFYDQLQERLRQRRSRAAA
jgi:3',5'-nucleoside bisphosphate phosphatase